MRVAGMLLAAGGAAAGAALWSRRSRRGIPALPDRVGGKPIEFHWRGHRIAGAVQGDGPPVLLVHAIHAAASSWEWRHTVEPLARDHSVYTLDLLGFGRSERPDTDYTAELYIDLITAFARQVIGRPCALVANSLAGAHALIAGARAPDFFHTMVLVQPTGMTRLVEPSDGSALQNVVRSRVLGEQLFEALTSRPSIRFFLRQTYADPKKVTEGVVADHAATARQPGGRFAPAAFVGFRLNADTRPHVPRIVGPTLLVWGSAPHSNPLSELEAYRQVRPDWEVAVIEGAGDLPHDERPQQFNAILADFLSRATVYRGGREDGSASAPKTSPRE